MDFKTLAASSTCFVHKRRFILICDAGSFRNPPPGQPRSSTPNQSNLGLGQKVTDLHDPVARANFRVVVIRPEEVERLDLNDQENGKRWIWKWTEELGNDTAQWHEIEVWP